MAAGSIGAIFGAILDGFVTLPLIGSTMTFAACGAATLLCLPFLRGGERATGASPQPPSPSSLSRGSQAPRTASSNPAFPACTWDRRGPEVRLIQASERRVPPDTTDHTVGLGLSYTEWIWSRMERDLGPAPSVLFIGGGGYTLPTKLLATRPEASAVAVENDPLVTEVVRTHMPRASKMIAKTGYDASGSTDATGRLGLVHADGRVYLNETDRRFDAAVMDAFSSNSVPAHLVTLETFIRLREIVFGPVYVNLIDREDGPPARGVNAILREVFPHVQVVDGAWNHRGRGGNILFVASGTPALLLAELPDGYRPATISDARAFTDDRGWTGHW
jgi:hypothetical protein